jgi:hypothetical protein
LRSIRVRKGPKNKDTMSGQCNKLKFRGDKLRYNSNGPIKPNVIMLAATVLHLFKNHSRNLFKLWDWSLQISLWGETLLG